MMQPRELALIILSDIEKNQAYVTISFQEKTEKAGLCARDAAFVKELVYGVLKRKLTLDYTIRRFSSVRLKKISVPILSVLRLGLYQLFYMDKVPESAAVNESVKLAGKYGHKASRGFVNALLRRAAKEGQAPVTEADAITRLSVEHSHPEALVRLYVETFGEKAEDLLRANNEIPPVFVRCNSLKTTREVLLKVLKEEGMTAVDGNCAASSLLLENGATQKLASYQEGLFTLQDQNAQLAALALMPKPGERVLDACAAPGGKTTHLAELMENEGEILALDVYEKRLFSVQEAAKRLGITIIKTQCTDASCFQDAKGFDKILADVPCSGLGVIRRRPDIKYKENITDFSGLIDIQKAILTNCATLLRAGGELVYSTCTVNPLENEGIVQEFLQQHKEFSLMPIENPYIYGQAAETLQNGMGTFYPKADGGDGFFIAKLKKEQL